MGSQPIRIQLGKILRKILAGKSCGKFLQENLAGKSCRKLLREIVAGKSCGKFLRENLEGNSYSLIWGSHKIWGKGGGDTLDLL